MNKKPRNIWIIIVLMLIIIFLLIGYTVNNILETEKDLENEGDSGLLKQYLDILRLNLNVDTLIWSVEIIISFLLIIGIYYLKKWAWIGGLMFGFFQIFGHAFAIIHKVANNLLLGLTEYPYFNYLNLVFNISFIVMFSIVFYLLFRPDVKSYFKIVY